MIDVRRIAMKFEEADVPGEGGGGDSGSYRVTELLNVVESFVDVLDVDLGGVGVVGQNALKAASLSTEYKWR